MNEYFGEIDVDIKNCQVIPEDSIDLRRSKLGNFIPFSAGYRDKKHEATHSSNPPVQKIFQFRKKKFGTFQIYAEILLIHTVDILIAK